MSSLEVLHLEATSTNFYVNEFFNFLRASHSKKPSPNNEGWLKSPYSENAAKLKRKRKTNLNKPELFGL